jgi:hypothetical protein
MTSSGARRPRRDAAQAAGWLVHQAIAVDADVAPGSWCKFAKNVSTGSRGESVSKSNAAAPNDSIEYAPGIGPSVSTSMLT